MKINMNKDTKGIDDVKETVSVFQSKIHQAKMDGEEWVETTPEIIAYFNRSGLNGSKYFIYDGIKVCAHGEMQAIIDQENIPLDQRKHGKEAAGLSSFTVNTKLDG